MFHWLYIYIFIILLLYFIILTVEPQPAGPTFARSARVNGTCTTYERIYIYIYIYKKHIYIYDEDFSQLYDKCGARAARQLTFGAHAQRGLQLLSRVCVCVCMLCMYVCLSVRTRYSGSTRN